MDYRTESKLQKNYEEAGGTKTAIPWASIISLVLELLSGCGAKDAKTFAKEHPIAFEFLVKNKLRREGNPNKEAALMAEAIRETMKGSSVADIQRAVDSV